MVKVIAKLDPARAQFQLKVTLLYIRPGIWRRLLVPANLKLPKFHSVLQIVFGWTNSHLHVFRVGDDSTKPIIPKPGTNRWATANATTKASIGCAICCTAKATA